MALEGKAAVLVAFAVACSTTSCAAEAPSDHPARAENAVTGDLTVTSGNARMVVLPKGGHTFNSVELRLDPGQPRTADAWWWYRAPGEGSRKLPLEYDRADITPGTVTLHWNELATTGVRASLAIRVEDGARACDATFDQTLTLVSTRGTAVEMDLFSVVDDLDNGFTRCTPVVHAQRSGSTLRFASTADRPSMTFSAPGAAHWAGSADAADIRLELESGTKADLWNWDLAVPSRHVAWQWKRVVVPAFGTVSVSSRAQFTPGTAPDEPFVVEPFTNGQSVSVPASTRIVRRFELDVPAGARDLAFNVKTKPFGGGSTYLYVKRDDVAAVDLFDLKSESYANRGLIRVAAPTPGKYHMLVITSKTVEPTTVTASYIAP